MKHTFNKFLQNVKNISKIWFGPLPKDSSYIKIFRFYYILNGKNKYRDLLKAQDRVAIVLYNRKRQKLIFIRHFRPTVFYNTVKTAVGDVSNVDIKKYPPTLGVTLELCSGIVDKNEKWKEKAREKILEKCGYDVNVERLEEVMSFRSGVGVQSPLQKLYYCEISDSDKSSSDDGRDEKLIEVVEYSIDKAHKLFQSDREINSPQNCLMGIMWFLMNKAPKN